MFITQKHISRRAVLKGAGVTMALPLLEAMIPARTVFAKTAVAPKTRFVCLEMVHGWRAARRSACRRTCGRRLAWGTTSSSGKAAS